MHRISVRIVVTESYMILLKNQKIHRKISVACKGSWAVVLVLAVARFEVLEVYKGSSSPASLLLRPLYEKPKKPQWRKNTRKGMTRVRKASKERQPKRSRSNTMNSGINTSNTSRSRWMLGDRPCLVVSITAFCSLCVTLYIACLARTKTIELPLRSWVMIRIHMESGSVMYILIGRSGSRKQSPIFSSNTDMLLNWIQTWILESDSKWRNLILPILNGD